MDQARYLIADMHTHPSMKPFRQLNPVSIWETIPQSNFCDLDKLPGLAKDITSTIATYSQTNLQKCLEGNVRAVINSFYIPERQMFQLRALADFLTSDEKEINLGACISGFDRSIVEFYYHQQKNNEPIDYFAELKDEYQYLVRQQSEPEAGMGGFRIATDVSELKAVLENEPNSVVAMMSLEGLHSLGRFECFDDMEVSIKDLNDTSSNAFKRYWPLYQKHINEMKQWGGGKHAPLYATVTHFFWNMICGHSRTAGGAARTFGINQNYGINTGFTAFGMKVIQELLSRDNGRRVIIDVKHMSPQARKEYYEYWKREHLEKKDPLPIICSHAAVNGIATLDDKRHKEDRNAEYEDSYFNTWGINLTDEDIQQIFQSGGLIGLIMQTDRIAGGVTKQLIANLPTKDLRRDEYARMYLTNAFHIVRVCNDKRAWDMISLGTDYDGLVNPFEYYPDYGDFQLLAQHVFQFLSRPIDNPYVGLTKDDYKRLMFGYSAEELTRKIMFGNVEGFLERHFHDDYLLGQKPTPPPMA